MAICLIAYGGTEPGAGVLAGAGTDLGDGILDGILDLTGGTILGIGTTVGAGVPAGAGALAGAGAGIDLGAGAGTMPFGALHSMEEASMGMALVIMVEELLPLMHQEEVHRMVLEV